MKKCTGMLMMIAMAGSGLAATLEYKPGGAPTPYDWADAAYWYAGAVTGTLPTSADNAWLTAAAMRTNPLYINSGTDVTVNKFYLGNSTAYTTPMQLTVNGGTFTMNAESYFGQKSAGLMTVQNGGAVTVKAKAWIGTACSDADKAHEYDAKVRVADAESSFTVKGSLYIGNQKGGVSMLENRGNVSLSGSGAGNVDVYLGWASASRTLGEVFGVIDNYGTITATTAHRYFIGGTEGYSASVTNHTGATINNAYAVSVGSGIGADGVLVNQGTINTARFAVGGDVWNGGAMDPTQEKFSVGHVANSGTMNMTSFTRIGYQTNSVGVVENTGNMSGAGELMIGYFPGSRGTLTHSAGTLGFGQNDKLVYVGYRGQGKLTLAGNTETTFDTTGFMIPSSAQSKGEFEMTDNAKLSLSGKNIQIGTANNSDGSISLGGNSQLTDIGAFKLGNRATDATAEIGGNALVKNVGTMEIGLGATSEVTGRSTVRLSGSACVTNVGVIAIGTNVYSKAVLEVAENAYLALPEDAMGDVNNILVANNAQQHGEGIIQMRGGTIALGDQGGVWLGVNTQLNNPGCTGRLCGYGRFINQGKGTIWSKIGIRSGSVTADGEGVERDLDMKTFGRIEALESQDRTYTNCSGTNGWYAVNKGRLLYPARDNETTTSTIGDYSRLVSDVPKFVNSVKFGLKDGEGIALSGKRRIIAELYASDRTDIPAGLKAEESRVSKRLGIWRAAVSSSLTSITAKNKINFATADTTVRYNHWLLDEFKDGGGNIPESVKIRLYAHDGSPSGSWKCLASYSAVNAEMNGYRISGEIEASPEVYNLGWFAVVATDAKAKGLILIVK